MTVAQPRDPNTPLIKEYTLNSRGLNIMILRYIPYLRGIGFSGKKTSFGAVRRVKEPGHPRRVAKSIRAIFRAISNTGALIVRIGFGVYSTIIIIRNPPKPYSN